MAYSIISNNRASRDAHIPAPQVKEDGTGYRFRMFYENNRYIVDADTADECVEVLSPGYLEDSLFGRADRRRRLVREVQTNLRARLISNADPAEWNRLEEWEQKVLSTLIGDVYGWGDGSEGWDPEQPKDVTTVGRDLWKAELPLVLYADRYQPVGTIPRPVSSEGDFTHVSNLVWLTSDTPETMLYSFSSTGFLTFGHPAGYDVEKD